MKKSDKIMSRRILFLVSEDWVFVSHRLHLAKYALEKQYEVILACNISTFGKVIEKEGIKLQDWAISRGSKNPIILLKNIWKTRQILKENRPDILIAVALKPIILVGFAKILLDIEKSLLCVTGLGSIFTANGLLQRF